LLINRASGERQNLQSELDKILNYSQTNTTISFDVINKLSNLSENYEVNELANNYLAKNTKNVSKILNENNYSNEDCILILRTLLNKSKKLLEIIKKNEQLKNIDQVLSSTKPPIFWKDKENIKIQAKSWKLKDLKNKIYEMNNVETLIKSNSKNSLNIISDFIVNY
jgi:DNA polymerase-3 subunit delta